MSTKIEIAAVADDGLAAVLSQYGLTEKLESRELACAHCTQPLTWENIGALLVKGGDLTLFCNLSACIDAAATGRPNG